MGKVLRISMFIVFMVVFSMPNAFGQEKEAKSDTLVVVWTSGDIELAEKMVYCMGPFGKTTVGEYKPAGKIKKNAGNRYSDRSLCGLCQDVWCG